MIKIIKNSKLAQNAILNTIAAAIPVVLLQLVILPILGRKIESDKYGLIVTILSFLNVIPATLGNALNNIRLIHNNEYNDKQIKGDFNIILLFDIVVNIIFSFAFLLCYLNDNNIFESRYSHITLVMIISILWLCREYFIVAFLINLNYAKILANNVILAVGYILGCIFVSFFNLWNIWEIIYLSGYIASLVYIMCQTDIWKEKLIRTPFLGHIFAENSLYILSCVLYRMISYADKMLLYPLLGGTEVSIYYVATLSGKIVNMLIMPLGGVILAHISKEKEVDSSSFHRMLRYGFLFSIVGYGMCILISRPVLRLLYPQFVDSAMTYIYVTTATICVGVIVSLINPFILKVKTMKWQAIVNGVTLLFYVISSVMLLNRYGLMGFCAGCLIANIIKLLMLCALFLKTEKEKTCH